jgi:transglutaminase-like putative cysteine protease
VTRLHVHHRTSFEYARTVLASYNEARMRPADLPHQQVLDARVTATPSSFATTYDDYWGTHVTAFEILVPHAELVVVAESTVDVVPQPGRGDAGWDRVRSPEVADRMSEFLATTPTTQPDDDLVELARDSIGDAEPGDAVPAILGALRGEVDYVTGVTGVHTHASEAWQARSGVCQDIAHLAAGALRAVGVPTRYVSGYLHPLGAQAQPGETVSGESHAWVEYWLGEWVGFDPTNRIPVDAHHVLVARGREYGVVTPLRGVYSGGGRSEQRVEVRITVEA